jgi:mono/diheme cytochrome c family protein
MIRIRRTRWLAGGAAVLGVAVAVGVPTAMGRVGQVSATQYTSPPIIGNVKIGKVLFIAACGGCHTLAAAETKGNRGPNLAREPSAYAALITQIKYGGEGMPAFKASFTKKQNQNIAAYVSKVTPYSGAGGD